MDHFSCNSENFFEKIGKIDGIINTETFVELQKTDKDPVYSIL